MSDSPEPPVLASTRIAPAEWTLDTLRLYAQVQIDGLRHTFDVQLAAALLMLQERYETQTKALDAAFLAQQTAMRTALEAAEKAVQTALVSAEKAVGKAETAAGERFEAVNKFREQLNDIVATMISRVEATTLIGALSDRLDAEVKARSDLDSRVTSRLDTMTGQAAGGEARAAQMDTSTRLALLVIGALVSTALLALALYAAFHKG